MSIFTKVAKNRARYSTFDLSHAHKGTGKMGELIPVFCEEMMPGDQFKIQAGKLLRMMPMQAPIMHQITAYCHFFFVPNRLLWNNWEDFITGGEDGTSMPNHPTVSLSRSSWEEGALQDYFGIPDRTTMEFVRVNALPFAAYFKVYNEYFRDQNIIDKVADTLNDGVNSGDFLTQCTGVPLKRAWQHDYLTSALPWTQRGPEATIPLGGDAPVLYDNDEAPGKLQIVRNYLDGSLSPDEQLLSDSTGYLADAQPTGKFLHLDLGGTHIADLSEATSATINDLRSALALQQWLERNARGGSRYIEVILSHFGVQSDDARLARPEFLGGSAQPIAISEVLQTSSSDDTTPQGNMAGHGISAGNSKYIQYRAKEHGIIIGIMSVMPKTAYSQGLHKKWTRMDKFDYPFPEFANLGEQPILRKEVNIEHPKPDDTFGYTPRYSEWKYVNDRISGEFHSSLDSWHLSRELPSSVALTQSFIECTPSDRIFAVQGQDHFMFDIHFGVRAKRPLPYFGTPKMIV